MKSNYPDFFEPKPINKKKSKKRKFLDAFGENL